jgi:phage shock protein PspC (stress-responsive transcriptional regulator)
MNKKLMRSRKNKQFEGVCAGLANYFEADVTIIRIIAFFAILSAGIIPGLFIYLIFAAIMPWDDDNNSDHLDKK